MKELEQQLEVIFKKHLKDYKSKFKTSGLLDKISNYSTFDNIFNKFINEIIEKSNEFSELDKTERESYLKKLIKRFNSLSLNPFD